MLKRLHEAHLGKIKTKQLARDTVFWPSINAQIEDVVRQCTACQINRNQQTAEPMITHETDRPDRPWSKVASDLSEYKGRNYIMCVDYYSKFPEINVLSNTTSSAVISSLKTTFARYGIPDELVSDNGPQYSSRESICIVFTRTTYEI